MTIQQQRKLLAEVQDLPEEVFPNLLQIVHLFKASVLQTRQEFRELHEEIAQ